MANEMTVQKTESLSNSEAFTNKVLKEFGSNVAGSIQVTDYQRQLIQGYFIASTILVPTQERRGTTYRLAVRRLQSRTDPARRTRGTWYMRTGQKRMFTAGLTRAVSTDRRQIWQRIKAALG